MDVFSSVCIGKGLDSRRFDQGDVNDFVVRFEEGRRRARCAVGKDQG